jgi:hypothetical protein
MSFKANFSSDSANSSARFNPGGAGATFSPKFNSGNSGGSGGGENGATFYPSVTENGDLSWSNDKGLENPTPVNIKGPKGADGYTPVKGVDYFDGKDGTAGYTPVKGVDYFDGKDGKDGKDGYTPVKGKDYFDGTNGKDGTSVTVSNVSTSSADGGSNVVTFSDGKTLTVKNGSTGTKGADGYTPVKGTDYFTEADKAELVQMVIESLGGNPIFGFVDENNNIIVQGNLADGTYSVKYEMEDGSTIDIGDLSLGEEPVEIVNQIPLSIDTDGSIYNDVGYMTNMRINSSGNAVSYDGVSVTGFIPVKNGDTVYLKGVMVEGSGMSKCHIYDANKASSSSVGSSSGYTDNGDGTYQFTLNNANAAFIRCSSKHIMDGSEIITINQPIS